MVLARRFFWCRNLRPRERQHINLVEIRASLEEKTIRSEPSFGNLWFISVQLRIPLQSDNQFLTFGFKINCCCWWEKENINWSEIHNMVIPPKFGVAFWHPETLKNSFTIKTKSRESVEPLFLYNFEQVPIAKGVSVPICKMVGVIINEIASCAALYWVAKTWQRTKTDWGKKWRRKAPNKSITAQSSCKDMAAAKNQILQRQRLGSGLLVFLLKRICFIERITENNYLENQCNTTNMTKDRNCSKYKASSDNAKLIAAKYGTTAFQ